MIAWLFLPLFLGMVGSSAEYGEMKLKSARKKEVRVFVAQFTCVRTPFPTLHTLNSGAKVRFNPLRTEIGRENGAEAEELGVRAGRGQRE